MSQDAVSPPPFQASVRAVEWAEKELEVVVRIANKADRALHYIADVRAIRYDPAAKTLTIALSDEGRQLLPTMAGNLPTFRFADPGSEAEFRLKVPNRSSSCRAQRRLASSRLRSTNFPR